MDAQYKQLYKEVLNLQHKLHDLLDDHAHPLAQALKNEVKRLEDELEMSKKPRSLEDRIKTIQQHLDRVKNQGEQAIMDIHHADLLRDRLEDFRMDLRRLPNY